jgi:hypothetical protein
VITDVELTRAVDALHTTLADQRPRDFDTARFQQIVDGALAGERKLTIVQVSAEHGELQGEDGRSLGRVDRVEGAWGARRVVPALTPGVAASRASRRLT